MKNMQMESKVRKHIDSIELPEVDVRKSVMSKINGSKERRFMPLKSKLSVALLVCIFIGTCGFAVSKVITMRDSGGNVLWKANLDVEEDDNILAMTQEKLDEIELLPGESALVFYKKGSGTERMTTRENPMAIVEFSEFKSNTGEILNLPESFMDKYKFENGTVSRDNGIDILQISEEARDHIDGENPFYTKKFKSEGAVKGGRGVYKGEENTFYVLIHEDFGNEMFFEKGFKIKEKVLVEDYEVIFNDNEGTEGVMWMKDNELFSIGVLEGEIERDELIEITKEVMKLNK